MKVLLPLAVLCLLANIVILCTGDRGWLNWLAVGFLSMSLSLVTCEKWSERRKELRHRHAHEMG